MVSVWSVHTVGKSKGTGRMDAMCLPVYSDAK